ncbi:MAG: DUF3343 domain-containing protein [Clostridiales bacterium]|nr:DUF3343 domain-containing protein [Candidatus Apopatousia equi]
MEYVIAVFSIRTETLMFNSYLQRLGINSTIINTPKETHTSCGISVKFPLNKFDIVKRVNMRTYRSFLGFFKYKNFGLKVIVSPIK